MHVAIRMAREGDLEAINAIYNYFVEHSTCTYQTAASTPEDRQAWFAARAKTWDGAEVGEKSLESWKARYPVTVAELAGDVVGWACLNPFHPRAAYRFTTENSVYVHHAQHRQGIGKTLLADLMQRADRLGFRSTVALISADQEASIRLHRAFGFTDGGYVRRVGLKFGRWLDVAFMQRENPGFTGT